MFFIINPDNAYSNALESGVYFNDKSNVVLRPDKSYFVLDTDDLRVETASYQKIEKCIKDFDFPQIDKDAYLLRRSLELQYRYCDIGNFMVNYAELLCLDGKVVVDDTNMMTICGYNMYDFTVEKIDTTNRGIYVNDVLVAVFYQSVMHTVSGFGKEITISYFYRVGNLLVVRLMVKKASERKLPVTFLFELEEGNLVGVDSPSDLVHFNMECRVKGSLDYTKYKMLGKLY